MIMRITPFKFLLILVGVALIGFTALGFYVYNTVSYNLPSLEQLENPRQNLATQVVSADGEVLDHFYIERRVSLPYDSIPKNFINALIATEDRKFYKHWGVHTGRVLNAVLKRIFLGKSEGASTITMQLARNLFLTQEKSMTRKIRESFIALEIEKTYTKEEILEMYANTVIFGRGAYGIQVAANTYFNKDPEELTLSECAYLVGLLKGPEKYNGLKNPEVAIGRRNLVLKMMYGQGFISEDQYQKSIKEPINLEYGSVSKGRRIYGAPHFVEMVRQYLKSHPGILKDYDIYRDGLTIYTTLNSRIQRHAEKAARDHFSKFQKTFDKSFSWRHSDNRKLLAKYLKKAVKSHPEYIAAESKEDKEAVEKKLLKDKKFVDSVKNRITTVQCGMVVLDPKTGAILAMVGASPKFMSEQKGSKYSLNHVTQINRQPGSAFKPFVYASALEEGMSPKDKIECGPYTYEMPDGRKWSPRGDGGCSKGDSTTLSDALRRSINTVAARLVTQVTTPEKVIGLAKRAGIKSALMGVPAIALGAGGEVSPLEMTSAYSTFANDGIHTEPFAINRIEDKYGNVIYEKKKSFRAIDAMKPDIAHKITSMLRLVVESGTGSAVNRYLKTVEAAGKTGTTNDYADAWFVGFTPQLAAGVWVGFDDRRITFTGGYGYASQAAVPLWGRMMANIYNDPKLPYKQKKFRIIFKDSLDVNYDNMLEAINEEQVNEAIDEMKETQGFDSLKLEKIGKDKKFPRLPKPKEANASSRVLKKNN